MKHFVSAVSADRRPQTADRRPQTADRRPQTADRRRFILLTRFLSIAIFFAIAMMTSPSVSFGQTCENNRPMNITESPCYTPTCTSGLFHPLGVIPANPLLICKNALGDGMRIHAYMPYEPMPVARFSYNIENQLDCNKDRAGRIGIMPPFTTGLIPMPPIVLYPVSTGNFQESDVFLVSTCDAKDLLLSTNNSNSRIKFLTTPTLGTQYERMTILNNGNVGIGTATPLDALQINQKLTFHVGANEYYIGYNQFQNSSDQIERIMSGSSATMGIMFKEDHNMMYITNNGKTTSTTLVN